MLTGKKSKSKIWEGEYFIIITVFFWILTLFVIKTFSISLFPLQATFLGGGLENYLNFPAFWSSLNFDGEHYLSIAMRGYQDLQYFYFPLYPTIIKYFSAIFGGSFTAYSVSGIVVSIVSFFIAAWGIWKLVLLDYDKNVAHTTLTLLLLFPTSFYFASFYTESLFLALCAWVFYLARTERWLLAGVLGALATATRIVGLALIPALLVEYWLQNERRILPLNYKKVLSTLFVSIGILIYMWFLNEKTGDPLEFFHTVSIFGQQRSSSLVLLPQVFYRYVFKVIPSINYNYFPVVFVTWLEFMTALFFGFLSVFSLLSFFRKNKRIKNYVSESIRESYSIFLFAGYIIPTFSGSFSSLPRYVVVLFPAFIIASIYFSRKKRPVRVIVYALLFVCLIIATTLFARGYWVS